MVKQQTGVPLPKSNAIPSYQMSEIQRKAGAGEQMMNPTPEKQRYYDNFTAQNSGYNSNNYQSGYGIGYGAGNVGGGFSDWNNTQALQNEKARMGTVLQNRDKYGLGGGTEYDSYMGKLDQYLQPFNTQQNIMDSSKQNYDGSQAKADADKWSNATIDDIAAKYGFDYSRDYAKQQAEAEAQALRNANQDAQRRNESNRDMGKSNIDANLMTQAEAMDRDYFQQMMQQQQNQVGTGMNAGIASDQDFRLQMARQAEMGGAYRDGNQGKMQLDANFNLDDIRLAEAMGLIDQQSLAREDSLYNERLNEGYNLLGKERNYYDGRDDTAYDRYRGEYGDAQNQQNTFIDQNFRQDQANIGNQQWQDQFDYGKGRDKVADQQWQADMDRLLRRDDIGDAQWQKDFDRLVGRDKVQDSQWQSEFDWSKVLGNHSMSMDKQQLALSKMGRSSGGGGGGGGGGGSSSKSSGGTSSSTSALGTSFMNALNSAPQTPSDIKAPKPRPSLVDEAFHKAPVGPIYNNSKDIERINNRLTSPLTPYVKMLFDR